MASWPFEDLLHDSVQAAFLNLHVVANQSDEIHMT